MREDNVSFDEVRLVCMDYTLTGLHAIFESCGNTSTSFRFLYISGLATERDQTKKPSFLPEYCLMRVSEATIREYDMMLSLDLGRDRESHSYVCGGAKRQIRSYSCEARPHNRGG